MADPQHVTLVANTVSTVTLTGTPNRVDIVNVDGSAAVYATVNGATPTVAGNGAWVLPAAICNLELPMTGNGSVVKLISAGTPAVSVGVIS